MKKFYILALVAILFAACDNVTTDEGYNSSFIAVDASDTLYAEFAEENTRTYVEEGNKLRWTKGDEISYFPAITYNMQYRFKGETGDNSGAFAKVTTDLVTGNKLDNCYAVYPYIESTTMTDDGAISFELPATQHYAENSFGLGANVMVAITESEDDNVLRFKNAGGYLKLQLYGKDVVVKSIELKGNGTEKLAGAATITATYGAEPTIAMAEDATTTLTLDCGEGVELSNDAETATAFWFVLPATTFENGITVTVTDTEGKIFEKSTSNSLTIERNAIQPMAALEVKYANPEALKIYYTATEKVAPYVFGANIVSNEWDETTGKGVITYDGEVTEIGEDAFHGRTSLTSITIGNSVTSIGGSAFSGCTSLTSVTIGKRVTKIGEYAFFNCTSLTSIAIPNSVTEIGKCAFCNCASLTSITIPDRVTEIGESTFNRCYNLTNVTIGNNVKTISMEAFMLCESLKSITIPDSVTYIGYYAFEHCYALENVIIGNSVKTIDRYTFWDCRSLKSITIPDSVTFIGGLAFYQCTSLKDVYCMAKTPPALGENVFTDCASGIKFYVRIDSLDAYTVTWSKYAKSIIADYTPTECTSLTIEADDVPGYMTSTTIRYSAITNGVSFNRYHVMDIPITGEVTSSQFDMNTSLTDSVERTISFSYLGKSATTTIIQGPSLAKSYTVNLNDEWQNSSAQNPDSALYDGVYESFSNYRWNRHSATMYIEIAGYEEFTIYVRRDCEFADNVKIYLDSTLITDTVSNSSDTSLSSYTEVKFSGLNPGPHSIRILYKKDESDHEGADRAYVFIPKNQ